MLKTTKNRTKLRFVNGSFVQVELPNFSSIYMYIFIVFAMYNNIYKVLYICFCYVHIIFIF